MEEQERNIASVTSLVLDLPPSCIEFCPAHPDYFVIGTYNLQKEEATDAPTSSPGEEEDGDDADEKQQTIKQPQSRDGSLVVFRLTKESDMLHIQTVPYPSAILDLHFHPDTSKHEVMAVVSSTGNLSFFRLSPSPETSQVPLKEIATHKPLGGDEGVLFLSCSWHPRLHNLIAVTTSTCEVHVLRVDDTWGIHETRSEPVITHTLEAWTVAFSPTLADPLGANDPGMEVAKSLTVFSGGDDSKLLHSHCVYRTDRGDEDDEVIETPYPTSAVRGHEAGVTAILPLNLKLADGSEVVVTGSYDDHVRAYSFPAPRGGMTIQKPKLLADENLGGGVWRLKLVKLYEVEDTEVPEEGRRWTGLILASCMHAGSRILEVTGNHNDLCNIRILGRFEEHKSMNYGSDFQPGSELMGQTLHVVSTSFYDRLLCLWEY